MIVTLDFGKSPPSFDAGGHASASAADNSKITITGRGMFGGTPDEVTGGGNWTTFDPGGTETASGTLKVTRLI